MFSNSKKHRTVNIRTVAIGFSNNWDILYTTNTVFFYIANLEMFKVQNFFEEKQTTNNNDNGTHFVILHFT